jgi:calreticulin
LSAKLDSSFTNTNKDLVIQFSVKHEQELDCGGAYIKLLGDMDQSKFGGDTPYQVMFGPDICGSTRRTHVIFNYPPKNDNLLVKDDVRTETDRLSHLYTLHVKPDNTFEVFIDQESVRSGSLEEQFNFLLSKEIKDPGVSKPADWVDAKKIPTALLPYFKNSSFVPGSKPANYKPFGDENNFCPCAGNFKCPKTLM